MARVKEWIDGFMKRHKARFAPHDWPTGQDTEESKEFLLGWLTGFATRTVTEEEANEASKLLAATPPRFRNEHLPAILTTIEAQRQLKGGGPAGSQTREAARDSSSDCPHCGGDGLAMAWAERPDAERRIPETVASHCLCRHGRWIRQAIAEKSPELLRRIPDYQAVVSGYLEGWLDHPPGRPEMAVGYRPPVTHREPEPEERNHEPVSVPFNRRDVNDMFRPTQAR